MGHKILFVCFVTVCTLFSFAASIGIIAAGVSAGIHLYRSISHVCN